jgi:hypothetical protein
MSSHEEWVGGSEDINGTTRVECSGRHAFRREWDARVFSGGASPRESYFSAVGMLITRAKM